MKYFWIGAGILAVVLAGSLLLGSAVRNSVREPQVLLERAIRAAEADNTEEAEALARQAAEAWRRHKGILSSLLSHEELEEASRDFTQLLNCDPSDFRSLCNLLYQKMQNIAEYDVLFFYNFLIWGFFT